LTSIVYLLWKKNNIKIKTIIKDYYNKDVYIMKAVIFGVFVGIFMGGFGMYVLFKTKILRV
jgi:hypothetical protein